MSKQNEGQTVVRKTTNRMTIEVSQPIIETSVARRSGHCMIAEAIKKAVPWAWQVSVDIMTIRFSDREAGERYIYHTPVTCVEKLILFDRGRKPKAWTFRLPRKPQQITKMRCPTGNTAAGKPNVRNRPANSGPKTIDQPEEQEREQGKRGKSVPTVMGGAPPPTGLLCNSGRVSRRRVYGARVTAHFDPDKDEV